MRKYLVFFIYLILMISLGCNKATQSAGCDNGKVYDPATRACVENVVGEVFSDNHKPLAGAVSEEFVTEDVISHSFGVPPGSDEDGDVLSYFVVSSPSYGTIEDCMNASGSTGLGDLTCTYLPTAEFAGTDSFTYRIHDGKEYGANYGSITFTFTGSNDSASFIAFPTADATAQYEDTPNAIAFTVDEGAGGSDEDNQVVTITVNNTGNTVVAPESAILISWKATPIGYASNSPFVLCDATVDCGSGETTIDIVNTSNTNTSSAYWGAGSAILDIKVEDNLGGSTTLTAISRAITAVDDIPIFDPANPTPTAIATATADEDVGIALVMTVDEGGSIDEDATDDITVTVEVTPNTGTAIPLTQMFVEFAGAPLGDASTPRAFGSSAVDVSLNSMTLYITPIAESSGITDVALTFTDSGGNAITQSFSVVINDVNDAPVFTTAPAAATGTPVAGAEDTPLAIAFGIDEGGGSDEDIQNMEIMAEVQGTCEVFENSDITISVAGTAVATAGAWLSVDADSTTDASGIALEMSIVPNSDYNGECGMSVSINDDILGTPEAVATFGVKFAEEDDAPTIATPAATYSINEGTEIRSISLAVDEGGRSGGAAATPIDEDAQDLSIKVTSDDLSLLPNNRIKLHYYNGSDFYYDGVGYDSLGDMTDDHGTTELKMHLWPVEGYNGTVNVTVEISDTTSTASTTVTLVVNDNSYTMGYWTKINASGGIVDAMGTPDSTAVPQVDLAWDVPTPNGTSNTLMGYNVYRVQQEKANVYDFDLDAPVNSTPLSSAELADVTVTPGTIYHYMALPVNTANQKETMVYNDDRIIRVVVPPENQVLVHRMMANKEFCDIQGSTVERGAHYRCPYEGLGEVVDGGSYFYDIEYDLLVDKFEAGCNYGRAENSECMEKSQGCLDMVDPYATPVSASPGTLYYDRSTAKCWVNTDGAYTWKNNACEYGTSTCDSFGTIGNCIDNTAAFDPSASLIAASTSTLFLASETGAETCYENTDGATTWTSSNTAMKKILYNVSVNDYGVNTFNRGSLPPLAYFSQLQANTMCAGSQIAISNHSSSPFTMRLPNREEQVAYGKWDSSITISSIEGTGDLTDASGPCNTDTDNKLTYINSPAPTSLLWDGLPATDAAKVTIEGTSTSLRSVITNSTATKGCESFYGVRDHVGNLSEWGDELFSAYGCETSGATIGRNCTDFDSTALASGTPEADYWTINSGGAANYNFESSGLMIGPSALSTIDPNRAWVLSAGPADSANQYDGLYQSYGLPTLYADVGLPASVGTPISLSAAAAIMSNDAFEFSNDFNVGSGSAITDLSGSQSTGGSYFNNGGSSDSSGRYSIKIIRKFENRPDTGFRCVAPVGY
ncbi:MAG: Ig-like domain-containing protein [Bacteriovoracaceae bacterium]|nr:Ig-like domain-containing protein [Bacteriovoracaceae bacterium]